MGYKQFLRSIEASNRRQERASMKRHRELVKHAAKLQREHDKQTDRQNAANEVELFDNYLDVLVSVHKDCGDVWDWNTLARGAPVMPPPEAPLRGKERENAALQHLADYRPGFFVKLFGQAKKRRRELEAQVERATSEDLARHKQESADHEAILEQHNEALLLWDLRQRLARGVLKKDAAAYKDAIVHVDPFSELAAFKTRVEVAAIESDAVALTCFLEDEELVPREEIKLTAASKVTTKEMPAARYWGLHQDFVCSCALRAARETLAALPVSRVVVNIQADRMNSSTGHREYVTILAVHFTRGDLERINMDAIDPSDSLKNFNFRMKFRKSSGFEPVEPISTDEQWVSA